MLLSKILVLVHFYWILVSVSAKIKFCEIEKIVLQNQLISSLELGVFFAIVNCICLSFMQVHTHFYFNYFIYFRLLIFCCQNVAMHLL